MWVAGLAVWLTHRHLLLRCFQGMVAIKKMIGWYAIGSFVASQFFYLLFISQGLDDSISRWMVFFGLNFDITGLYLGGLWFLLTGIKRNLERGSGAGTGIGQAGHAESDGEEQGLEGKLDVGIADATAVEVVREPAKTAEDDLQARAVERNRRVLLWVWISAIIFLQLITYPMVRYGFHDTHDVAVGFSIFTFISSLLVYPVLRQWFLPLPMVLRLSMDSIRETEKRKAKRRK